MKNKLKQRLLNNETCIGMFLTICSTELVEMIGITGYDFVVIDTEHGPGNTQSILPLLIAAERRDICPIVRIPEISPSAIVRTLDIGAYGLQAPQVGTAEDAKSLIQHSKYYPKGLRGMGSPRAGDYGLTELGTYIKEANDETLLVAQCESREGYESLENIAVYPDIDVLFLGPYDMSQSLGIPGDVNSAAMEDMRGEFLRTCRKHRKIPGTFAQNGDDAKRLKKMGFQYITMGMEVDHILSKFKEEIGLFNEQ